MKIIDELHEYKSERVLAIKKALDRSRDNTMSIGGKEYVYGIDLANGKDRAVYTPPYKK